MAAVALCGVKSRPGAKTMLPLVFGRPGVRASAHRRIASDGGNGIPSGPLHRLIVFCAAAPSPLATVASSITSCGYGTSTRGAMEADAAPLPEAALIALVQGNAGWDRAQRVRFADFVRVYNLSRTLRHVPGLTFPTPQQVLTRLPHALTRLARMGDRLPRADVDAALVDLITQLHGDSSTPRAMTLQRGALNALAPHIAAALSAGRLTPRQVALVSWSYGRALLRPTACDLWAAVATACVAGLPSLPPGDLTRIMWGIAQARNAALPVDARVRAEWRARGWLPEEESGAAGGAVPTSRWFSAVGAALLSRYHPHGELDTAPLTDFSVVDCAVLMDTFLLAGPAACPPALAAAVGDRCIAFMAPYVPVRMLAWLQRQHHQHQQAAHVAEADDVNGRAAAAPVPWWERDHMVLRPRATPPPHVSAQPLVTDSVDTGVGVVATLHTSQPPAGVHVRPPSRHQDAGGPSSPRRFTPGRPAVADLGPQADLRDLPHSHDLPGASEEPGGAVPIRASDEPVAGSPSRHTVEDGAATDASSALTSDGAEGAEGVEGAAAEGGAAPSSTTYRRRDMRVGEMRAFIAVAWCLVQLQHWHGPFFAYFKRLYPQLAPRLQARDTLRLVTINSALQSLSPFPNLALGRFTVVDIDGMPVAHPAIPVKREATVDAIIDPMGMVQSTYVPGVRRSDLTRHKALLAAVRSRWQATAPSALAPHLLGTCLTGEGLLLDFCVPHLRLAGKLVTAANFTPDTQQLDAATQLEAAIAHAAGWRVVHVAAFGADAESAGVEAQRAVDEMMTLAGASGAEIVGQASMPLDGAAVDVPAVEPAASSPVASGPGEVPRVATPAPAAEAIHSSAPVAASPVVPGLQVHGSVARALSQRGFLLRA